MNWVNGIKRRLIRTVEEACGTVIVCAIGQVLITVLYNRPPCANREAVERDSKRARHLLHCLFTLRKATYIPLLC